MIILSKLTIVTVSLPIWNFLNIICNSLFMVLNLLKRRSIIKGSRINLIFIQWFIDFWGIIDRMFIIHQVDTILKLKIRLVMERDIFLIVIKGGLKWIFRIKRVYCVYLLLLDFWMTRIKIRINVIVIIIIIIISSIIFTTRKYFITSNLNQLLFQQVIIGSTNFLILIYQGFITATVQIFTIL